MDQYLIISHAILGVIALATGSIAIGVKKGGKVHRLAGKLFFYSMISSAVIAILITIIPGHFNPFLFSIGVFTCYLLISGYRSLAFRRNSTRLLFDYGYSSLMVIVGVGMILIPIISTQSINIILLAFGAIGCILGTRDLLLYQKPEQLKKKWLKLHIGKITGAYIASLSAFLVVNDVLPGLWNWFAPTIVGSFFISYWIRNINRKKFPKALSIIIMISMMGQYAFAQVYVQKQSRHRFAQLNIGIDYQWSIGGQTYIMNNHQDLTPLSLTNLGRPRILIGGTHFWGHADIYIAFPLLYPSFTSGGQELFYTSGVETSFKYYPWRIEQQKVRPFVGFSIAPFFYSQDEINTTTQGPEKTRVGLPLMTGLTYYRNKWLWELNLTYDYHNQFDYFISPSIPTVISSPPIYLSFSMRYMFDTSLSAEKEWESGKTAIITKKLTDQGKLNNFFLGVGFSSAWTLGQSSYNQINYPFISEPGISVMPEFSLGYYWNSWDIHLGVSRRAYSSSSNTYGVRQNMNRRSYGLELVKFLGDYHGFVPFLGPCLSQERLSFTERTNVDPNLTITDHQIQFGITFGWDIRPNRLQQFILRTNLRYFPNLKLDITNQESINFNTLEFNFIQLILFPERIF